MVVDTLIPLLVSWLSYRVCFLFLLMVPFTHVGGVLLLTGGRWMSLAEGFLFPFTGGTRHVVFQLSAWVIWAVSALAIVPVWVSAFRSATPGSFGAVLGGGSGSSCSSSNSQLLHDGKASLPFGMLGDAEQPTLLTALPDVQLPWLSSYSSCVLMLPIIPHTHVDVISGAAAASSFIGELFMVKALLVYDGTVSNGRAPVRKVLTPRVASFLVVFMGLLLSVTGFLLLLAVEHMPDIPSRVLYCCMALSCLLIGASCTHGLGGHLRWSNRCAASKQQLADGAGAADSKQLADSMASQCGKRRRRRQQGRDSGAEDDHGEVDVSGKQQLGRRRGGGATGGSSGGMAAAAEEASEQWSFFQPFTGGTAFVATQAVGWTLFALTVVYVIALVKALVAGVVYCLRCYLLGAGALMLATQAILAVSVLTWRTHKVPHRLLQPALLSHPMASLSTLLRLPPLHLPPPPPATKQGLLLTRSPSAVATYGWRCALAFGSAVWQWAYEWHAIIVPVTVMFMPIHLFFTAWALSFTFLPSNWALAFWAATMPPYYITTMRGVPHHTGSRKWQALRDWFTRHLDTCLSFWFDGVKVVRDFDYELDPSKKYIFSYAPHGLYPIGAGYLPLLPAFQRLMKGINPVTLTASVIFYPPAVRDIAGWIGFRQVSRSTFSRALRENGSVILCPGGQAELVYTYKAFAKPQRELVIYAGHKGFVRMAIEQGANLVPVLALGETLQVANGIDMPRLQLWSYKRFGFPVPFIISGRWGLTPLPRKVPLVFVIGEPIAPPEKTWEPGSPVPEEVVEALHARFYSEVSDMFARHAPSHPLLADAKLVIMDSHDDGL